MRMRVWHLDILHTVDSLLIWSLRLHRWHKLDVFSSAFDLSSPLFEFGSPSQGSEYPRMLWSHFAPPDFRVLSGINRFLINENRFWNSFSKQSTRKIQNTLVQTSFRYLKTGSETGLYRKVLENVTGAKWQRNILGRSDPWEGDPYFSPSTFNSKRAQFNLPPRTNNSFHIYYTT